MTNGDTAVGVLKNLIETSKVPMIKQSLESLLTYMTDADGKSNPASYASIMTFGGMLVATNEKACNIFDTMVFDMQRKIDSQASLLDEKTPKTVM